MDENRENRSWLRKANLLWSCCCWVLIWWSRIFQILMACRWNTMTTMVFHCPCVDDFRGVHLWWFSSYSICGYLGCCWLLHECKSLQHCEFTSFASWGKSLLHCCRAEFDSSKPSYRIQTRHVNTWTTIFVIKEPNMPKVSLKLSLCVKITEPARHIFGVCFWWA